MEDLRIMTHIRTIYMHITWLMVCVLSTIQFAMAQKPEIRSIDKMVGPMEEIITIKGAFFGTDATKLAVTFGATKADILSITDQILEVKVPSGTLYNTIAITNLTTGLSGHSTRSFLLSFSGKTGFALSNLQGQFNFPPGAATAEGLYDLCLCDFDGDRKNDVATANDNFKFINIYPNGSSVGTVSFPSRTSVNIASLSLHIKCGDLNGDGKPDLIATESGSTDKIFILKNVSTGLGNFSFAPPITLTMTGKRPKRIEIADMDLDGKPEVLVTSQGSNTITVLINQSTLAAISFSPAPPIEIRIPGAVSTEGLAVEDLNGDELPEIVTSQFQTNSNIYIVENKSSPGSFASGGVTALNVGTPIKNIRVGDLDGDNKPDIAFTQLISSTVGIFLNNSTSAISFSSLKTFDTEVTPWGIDFGDLDGDGKTDIAIASLTKKAITILNNKSSVGNLVFNKLIQPTTYINRHINIGDVDTDGKPDLIFTSIDDNNLNIPSSKVSVFRNKTCMIPQVTPGGPLNICSTFPVLLKATKGGGATYEWTNTTTNVTVSGINEYTPTVSGDYIVKAISESGSCSEVSNIVKITISPGTAADPLPINDGPTCIGQSLNLKISNDLGVGYTYEWSGPENYSSTGLNPAAVPNFKLINAGKYYVDVKAASGCIARREATLVEAVDVPDFKVGFIGSDVICSGDLKQLNIVPNAAGFSYQWYEKTAGLIAGATMSPYTIGTSGEYYYSATSSNPSCPVVSSSKAVLKVVTLPVAAFTLPATACKGQEINFSNQSTFDSQATVGYAWAFGDGGISTDQNPKHIYTNIGSFTVSLIVSYNGNACPATVTQPISITDAPTVTITTDLNKFEICPQETLVLLATGTFTSYVWSTGETTPTSTINEAGDYSLTVTAPNGCELKTMRTITPLPEPEIEISATPEVIDEGQTVQLSASGLVNYNWTPVETLSEATLSNPVAIPLSSITYTVSGKDINNCKGTATVNVKVRGEPIVKKLSPQNFFSPDNGDVINPFWVVEKIEEYPQCRVTIYDDKGVRVFDAKPYMNDWDGSFNGKRLPDGVYYYIIRCEGEEGSPRSGSITMLR